MKLSIDQETVMNIKELAKPIVRYLKEKNIAEIYVECSVYGIGFRNAVREIKAEDLPSYHYRLPDAEEEISFISI